jgi:hypothetical protein
MNEQAIPPDGRLRLWVKRQRQDVEQAKMLARIGKRASRSRARLGRRPQATGRV